MLLTLPVTVPVPLNVPPEKRNVPVVTLRSSSAPSSSTVVPLVWLRVSVPKRNWVRSYSCSDPPLFVTLPANCMPAARPMVVIVPVLTSPVVGTVSLTIPSCRHGLLAVWHSR